MTTTQPRIAYWKHASDAYKALEALEKVLHDCPIEAPLLHLIKLRASMLNNCAYCIDMHWKDLRALGETEQRLYGLSAWEESPYYSERERAALAWCDALTNIQDGHAPDELFAKVREHFNEAELSYLTFACAAINAWNRLGVSMRSPAGGYKSRLTPATV